MNGGVRALALSVLLLLMACDPVSGGGENNGSATPSDIEAALQSVLQEVSDKYNPGKAYQRLRATVQGVEYEVTVVGGEVTDLTPLMD